MALEFIEKGIGQRRDEISKVPPSNMRNSPLTTVLLALLGLSAVVSLGLFWKYSSRGRELRALQVQVQGIQNNRNFVLALAQDALEYSKTHPAIDPILEEAKLKTPKTGIPTISK